jgi:hypothetical protein
VTAVLEKQKAPTRGAFFLLRPMKLLKQLHRIDEGLENAKDERNPDKTPRKHELKSRGFLMV